MPERMPPFCELPIAALRSVQRNVLAEAIFISLFKSLRSSTTWQLAGFSVRVTRECNARLAAR